MPGRPTTNPSGLQAAGTTTLFTGKCTVNYLQLISDGTNACSVKVYDNTAASGKQIAQLNVVASSAVPAQIVFDNGVKCEIGVTIIVAGTGSNAIVGIGGS